MEIPYIDVERLFRPLTGEEAKDSESVDSFPDLQWLGYGSVVGWSDIENRFRTVLLAEAGAGKTREMKERCNLLRHSGKLAFFLPLEHLERDPVRRLLKSKKERDSFQKWVDDSTDVAWFFLDALDELKLRDGVFGRALFNLSEEIRGADVRARIIVSCRPSDWDLIDVDDFLDVLPAPEIIQGKAADEADDADGPLQISAEERFLNPLRGKPGLTTDSQGNVVGASVGVPKPEELIIYKLLPLGSSQIKKFIDGFEMDDPGSLVSEIEREDAWDFGRSPQDIIEMISIWNDRKSLGSRTEQHEAHIRARLRDRSRRPALVRQLSDSKARLGVERLALAMALSKRRTIRIPDSEHDGKSDHPSIDAVELLDDWPPADIKALLSLGLFDPPTFGRVQFHRRSIQEYLAAGQLQRLAVSGNASKGFLLRRLFTRSSLGELIVVPSLRLIAAWLARSNAEIRRNIIDIDPELLIFEGDPEQIPVEDRKRLLMKIVSNAVSLGSYRLAYSPAALRRFASPELEDSIQVLWQQAEGLDSVVELLLSLVKEGGIRGCGDLVYRWMWGDKKSSLGAIAMQALIACGETRRIEAICKDLVSRPDRWSPLTIQGVIMDVFPAYINAAGLLHVVKSAISNQFPGSGFAHAISAICDQVDPRSVDAIELRNGLVSLILENQVEGSTHYSPVSSFSWVSSALSAICLRQAAVTCCEDRPKFLRACITANFFRNDYHYARDDLNGLRAWIGESSVFTREFVFVTELEFSCDQFRSLERGPIVIKQSLLEGGFRDDRKWLVEIAENQKRDSRIRLSALLELVRLWTAEGRPKKGESQFRKMGKGHPELEEWIQRWLQPPVEEPEEWKALRQEREDREKKRIGSWLDWRSKLLADPDSHFKGDRLPQTMRSLLDWMMADCRSSSSYQFWNRSVGIEQAFNTRIKEAARRSFASFWRTVDYQPFSDRAGLDSGTSYSWLYGLNGVLAEADSRGWIGKLNEEDVRQASLLALVEINGLPAYLDQLAEFHPKPVSEVLSKELAAQLNLAEKFQHLPLLQHLAHGSRRLKMLLKQPLLDFVQAWRNQKAAETGEKFMAYHLSQVLRILAELSPDWVTTDLEAICARNFERDRDSMASVHWLRALMSMDAPTATTAFERTIKKFKRNARKERAVFWLGSLFDSFQGVRLNLRNESHLPDVLARLSRLAYTYIVPCEDQHRESGESYTPDDRDGAQYARSWLLNRLIELPGDTASEQIEALSVDPLFESAKDYLRNRVRVRYIESAEPAPLSIGAIRTLESRFEVFPADRDSLFEVMMNRLEDLQHDVSHHDFFPRRTIQSIGSEDEMQRLLSLLLEEASNNAYSIVREDESADAKRTDIRMLARNSRGELRAVIEVKIADSRWSCSQFIRALEAQLIGQYLRHETCRAGCLLLTYNGSKSYWLHPRTSKRLYFPDLIEFLRSSASALERAGKSNIRVEVFGLDLRDPKLKPAHG